MAGTRLVDYLESFLLPPFSVPVHQYKGAVCGGQLGLYVSYAATTLPYVHAACLCCLCALLLVVVFLCYLLQLLCCCCGHTMWDIVAACFSSVFASSFACAAPQLKSACAVCLVISARAVRKIRTAAVSLLQRFYVELSH